MSRFLARTILATAAVAGLSVGSAQASCSENSLKGSWQFYALATDDSVTTCRITIDKSGAVEPATCSSITGASQTDVNLISGSLSLSNRPNCAYTGTLNLGGETNTIRLTLAQDKSIANGYGSYSGGLFMFSLTKVK
mgnify:CR=1 FL=1